MDRESKQELRNLLEDLTETLDQINEICDKDGYLRAYVMGNVWAKRYGFLGKAGLDYLDEWLEENPDQDLAFDDEGCSRLMENDEYQPDGWKLDPSHVVTETVQYWRNGVMMTAQMTLERAREMVRNGTAFVISSQAIGSMRDGLAVG